LLFCADYFDEKKISVCSGSLPRRVLSHLSILTSSIQNQRNPLIVGDIRYIIVRSASHQIFEGNTNAAHPSRFLKRRLSQWSWGLSQRIRAASLLLHGPHTQRHPALSFHTLAARFHCFRGSYSRQLLPGSFRGRGVSLTRRLPLLTRSTP